MTKNRSPKRAARVARPVLVFVAIYGALMTIVFFWGAKSVERVVNLWTAKTTAWALQLLGAHGRAQADIVQSSLSTIRIVSECTALYPAVIFASAVLAFRSSWKDKLLAAIGLPILAVINLVRIVSLCYIERWYPSASDTAHFVVWQSLMIFVTVLLWLLWATRCESPRGSRAA